MYNVHAYAKWNYYYYNTGDVCKTSNMSKLTFLESISTLNTNLWTFPLNAFPLNENCRIKNSQFVQKTLGTKSESLLFCLPFKATLHYWYSQKT